MLRGILSTHSKWCLVPLVLACLCITTMPATASSILNSDFETGDLTGWTTYNDSPQVEPSIVTSPVISGSYSVLTPTSVQGKGSALCGELTTPLAQFHYSADIAAMTSAADRILQIQMRTADVEAPTVAGGGQINMYVNPSGDLYVYEQSVSWHKIGSGVFNLTPDTNTTGWDGETPSVNTLEIIGDFSDSPSYEVILNGTNLGAFSYFQFAAPGSGSTSRELHWVYVQGSSSMTGAPGVLWDNISVESTAVPEPSTIAMLLAGVFGWLACVWRKRK